KSTEALPGLGDDAMMGPADSMLIFVKGRVGVTFGLTLIPDGRDKGMALAPKVAARLLATGRPASSHHRGLLGRARPLRQALRAVVRDGDDVLVADAEL